MADGRIVVLDACVLVQAPLRDTLLRLAEPPALYRPRWSDEIIIEMKRTLETRIGLPRTKTAYLERELRRHFADCWVTGFEHMVGKMTNDPKDHHVLAAAVCGSVRKIVTFNKRHFPSASTSPWSIEAVGPSAFLEELYADAPAIVMERIRQQAADLDRSLSDQLTVLAKAVPSFVETIRRELELKGD
ncbi:MAG: PIN domain-containing protein [Bryobacteraceae bacterium]|nr:PIN domain-containing protein [Bryobacteraceae bacterium]